LHTRTQARGATPELPRVADTTPHGVCACRHSTCRQALHTVSTVSTHTTGIGRRPIICVAEAHKGHHWPLQDILSLLGFRARIYFPCIPPPPALPTSLRYYCNTVAQYTTPLPAPRVYVIHHTILVQTVSCTVRIAPGHLASRIPTPTAVTI